jgi:hypothetical protein
MAIQELLDLVAPPAEPVEAVQSVTWEDIEEALGTKLPRDYRDFAYRYGSGHFMDGTVSFHDFNPLAARYFEELRRCCNVWRSRQLYRPDEFPAKIFPLTLGCPLRILLYRHEAIFIAWTRLPPVSNILFR